jgi:hypothetical protein
MQARSIDLLSYLQTYEPTELVHIRGNTYCTREHDSLKISNGKWMWWSRGFGGATALDYLIKVKGLSFTDAMKILTEGANASSFYSKKEAVSPTNENKKLLMPEKSETNDLKMMGDLAGSDKRYSFRTNSEGNDLKAYYKKTSAFTRAKGISLGKYVMTLFGEAEGKGLYCVIRDEGDFIDW